MQGDLAANLEALRLNFSQAPKSLICCPLCGSNVTSALTNSDRHDLGLRLVACRHCGMGMISPRPESRWFDEFYNNTYWPIYISSRFKDLDEMYIGDRCMERAEQIFTAIVLRFSRPPGSYLDVGCGQGAMLAQFRKRYPKAKYFGVEPSRDAAEFCRRRHGISIELAHWSSLESDKLSGPFDLITLIHVLEHVLDPVDALTRAVQRLSKTGLIYVEVPDLLSDKWSGKDFFHIAHVWYFHEIALRNLFLRCGLEVVSVTRGATEVWPWAVGLVGQRNAIGPQPSEIVTAVPKEFIINLKKHLVGRQLPTAMTTLPRRAQSEQLQTWSSSRSGTRKPMPGWIKAPVHNLVKRYTSVRVEEIQHLEKRLAAAEALLKFVSADETSRWLYQNRLERMDATLDIFDQKRRKFHLDRYRFAAQRVIGKSVLDCACGTGYGTRIMREAGGASAVVGVDIERKAIEYANKNHRVDSTSFICSSGDGLAFPNASVDVVTSFETIEHVPDDVALVEEFHRVLKPDGLLIISTPNQWPLADTPYHVREYDRESFIKVLDGKFACEEFYNQNSGSDTPLNRGQSAGIVSTTPENEHLAECYLAICLRR
jgi:2-polyprenyl-3-methyl-5-hydroxy-6-metoxy-1,4-benzoquinol methylase